MGAVGSCLQPDSLKCASGCSARKEHARLHSARDTSTIAAAAAEECTGLLEVMSSLLVAAVAAAAAVALAAAASTDP